MGSLEPNPASENPMETAGFCTCEELDAWYGGAEFLSADDGLDEGFAVGWIVRVQQVNGTDFGADNPVREGHVEGVTSPVPSNG